MIALFFLVYTGSIGVLPDGISRVRSLNRGNPHTHLLLWYLRLPGRVNHPLGAIWVVNHSHKKLDINTVAMGSVCREATLIQSSPPSPPTLPLLPLPGYRTQPCSSLHQPDLVSQHLSRHRGEEWPSQDQRRRRRKRERREGKMEGGDWEKEARDRGRQIK